MQMINRTKISQSRAATTLLVAAALLFSTQQAMAACSFQTPVTPMAFGAYDVLSAAPLDATATFQLRCTKADNAVVSLGASSNGSRGTNPREMKHATLPDLLTYNLYRDAGRTQVWGDTAGATLNMYVAANNRPFISIYGRIPAGQTNVTAGLYSDSVVLTVMP